MKLFSRVTTAILVGLAGMGSASAVQAQEETVAPALARCHIDGVREWAQCATLSVPLDYDDPSGGSIELFVAVIPALSGNPSPDPLFVFAGGPGQAAAEYGVLVDAAFSPIHSGRDIVLMDQRGTGRSTPLACDASDVLDRDDLMAAIAKCHAGLGIDASHFTMEAVVRDAEAVRAFLGAGKLNLWGGSWGTRTAALYLKRYPGHVRSVIVDGVLPPDVPLLTSSAKSAERAKRLLSDACRASDACSRTYGDLDVQVASLMQKADAGELQFTGPDPVSGKPMDLPIDFQSAVEGVRSVLYSAPGTVVLPYAIDAANKGDLKPFVAGMAAGNAMSESMYLGATLSILCGEEVPRVTAVDAEAAGQGSFARDSYYRFWSQACGNWTAKRPAPDAFEAMAGDVPLLALSGELDPVTPPAMAEHLVAGFPNGRAITVRGNGHISSYAGCMPGLIAEFIDTLDAAALDTSCLDHMERPSIVTGLNGGTQ